MADANRLAALSTTAGTLDLSLLLAAQAVRLADTPETQDGLLAALTEQGRAERVVAFDGDPTEMDLADGGRVVFFATGDATSWGRSGPSSPEPAAEVAFDTGLGHLDGRRSVTDRGGAARRRRAPTAALGAHDHLGRVDPGARRRDRRSAGLPLGAAFSADGRRVHLLVAAPERRRAGQWDALERRRRSTR